MFDVGPRDASITRRFGYYSAHVPVYVDAACVEAGWIRDVIRCGLTSVATPALLSKYVIPQIVLRHLTTPASPLAFDFDDWLIGIH